MNGVSVTVVFTGNEQVGDGSYALGLKKYVAENHLQNNCLFLGFIDRKEQLLLMKESIAVIQPSLFEGWSTVVEDAKCLGKFLLLSELRVHKEQVQKNAAFFDPLNVEQLAALMTNQFDNQMEPLNYSQNVLAFATAFAAAIHS